MLDFPIPKQYAVFFDMDGVICHTNPYHIQAFELLFEKHQINYEKKNFANYINGKHNSSILQHFFKRPICKEEFIQLEEEKESLFREIYSNKVKAIDGFIELLDKLRENKFKTGIATSAPKANMELIVSQLKIKDKMDSLLASEDINIHKPNPEIYSKSAKKVQVQPQNAIIFEDSFSGVTAGLQAGIKVIGVLSSHTESDLPGCIHYIKDFTQITLENIVDLLRK